MGQRLMRARYSGTVPIRTCRGGKRTIWKVTEDRPEMESAMPMSASLKPVAAIVRATDRRGHRTPFLARLTEATVLDGGVAEQNEESLRATGI